MAKQNLTAARLRQLVHYDPKTGVFSKRLQRKGTNRDGTIGSIYGRGKHRFICIDYKKYPSGRLAWLYMTGRWPVHQIDHKDRQPSNDAWKNLRLATNKQNQENRSMDGRNKSGFKGVYWSSQRQKWTAQIRHSGRTYHLGLFSKFEHAAVARSVGERIFWTHGYGVSKCRQLIEG